MSTNEPLDFKGEHSQLDEHHLEIQEDDILAKFTEKPHDFILSASLARVVSAAGRISLYAVGCGEPVTILSFEERCAIAHRVLTGEDMSELESASPIHAVFCEAVRVLHGRL
jgi:hypothetical protein